MANKIVQDYIKSLEGVRKDNQKRMHQAAVRWNELANNCSVELSKHLFTIASLVLPLSLLPITQENFVLTTGTFGKGLLVAAWMSFICSLIFGLLHLAREARFFNRWAKQENDRSLIYSESILTTSATKAFERLEDMNKKSMIIAKEPSTTNPAFLYAQSIFLIIGVVLIGAVLVSTLFNPQVSMDYSKNFDRDKWFYYNQNLHSHCRRC